MLLRSKACRNNAELWTVPGGMVEPFETLEQATAREVVEETGLKIRSCDFLAISDRVFDGQHWVSVLYNCSAEGEPDNLEPEKHLQIRWHDLCSLPENITLPSRDAIDAYLVQKSS